MKWSRLKFLAICGLLWPVAAFVSGHMTSYMSALLWWMAKQSGATTLTRPVFDTNCFLPMSFVAGLLLGCIPVFRLKQVLIAALTARHYQRKGGALEDLDKRSPALWAWVLPTALFLFLFATWSDGVGRSALIVVNHPVSRFAFFFGLLTPEIASLDPYHWFMDRLLLTGPMLFTMGYPCGVLLRYHFPRHPLSRPEDAEELAADTLGT